MSKRKPMKTNVPEEVLQEVQALVDLLITAEKGKPMYVILLALPCLIVDALEEVRQKNGEEDCKIAFAHMLAAIDKGLDGIVSNWRPPLTVVKE